MRVLTNKRSCPEIDERGFTLVEVLTTITIMGILFAIATSSWQGIVESRRVTSAANQLTANLRLTHSKSTNQLKEYAVVTDPSSYSGLAALGSADYYVVPLTSDGLPELTKVERKELDEADRVEVSGFGARFSSDGSASALAAGTTATVDLKDQTGAPSHVVQLNTTTSRVKIDP